jgi:hypothetical protein
MLNRRQFCAALFALTGQAAYAQNGKKKPKMTPTASLTLKPSGEAATQFLTEQEASFDIALRNDGPAAAEFVSLSLNLEDPIVELFDGKGDSLGEFTMRNLIDRMAGDGSTFAQDSPSTVSLGPGARESKTINLWSFTEPLYPGKYAVEVRHRPIAGGEVISSGRLPFSIVPAKVSSAALGFESAQRSATVLAWLAAPPGGSPRLLARLSGMNHESLHAGGHLLGEYPAGTQVAVSAIPSEGSTSWSGWIATVSGTAAELIRHTMTAEKWRTGPIHLPVADARPVPRFPDRERAVFLFTGSGSSGPVLGGAAIEQGAAPPAPWTLPVPIHARHSACLFGTRNPIIVLIAGDDGQTSSLYRIVVDEKGSVVVPAQLMRQTPNIVLDVTADLRVRARPMFQVLEADRAELNRCTLVHIALQGDAVAEEPKILNGWPKHEAGKPTRPAAISVEALGTELAIALTDGDGALYGGTMARGIRQISPSQVKGLVFPHIGALDLSTTISAFTPEGLIFHSPWGGEAN